METDVQTLFNEIRKYNSYPASIKRIAGEYALHAFFPGGRGLIDDADSVIAGKKIMVVAEQFHPNQGFLRELSPVRPRMKTTPFWDKVLHLLMDSDIDPLHCFFTNLVLGIRIPDKKPVKATSFVARMFNEHCKAVFRKELEMQKPKLILVLGMEAGLFLSTFHPKLRFWAKLRNFEKIDQLGLALMENIQMTDQVTTTLILIVNPSAPKSRVPVRKFMKYKGREAEIRMIKSVC